MRHRRPRREVVVETVELARHLPERQQRQAVAALIGLGHRFLTASELETLLEGLMITPIGQRLIDRGIERGIEQGIEQGQQQARQQDVLDVLTERFGVLPPSLAAQLAGVGDGERLRALLKTAVTAGSVEEFTRALQ